MQNNWRHLENSRGAIKRCLVNALDFITREPLKEQTLSEENYKSLILEHYTFLKRPVIVNSGQIFIGNSKKVVAQAKVSLQNK